MARSRSRSTSRPTPAMSLPLGSLTQHGTRAGSACQSCGSERVTQIEMNLTDGTPVEFVSCHRCEERSWSGQGEPMSVEHVLDRTRKPGA